MKSELGSVNERFDHTPNCAGLSRRGLLGAVGAVALVGAAGLDMTFAKPAFALSGPVVWPVGPSPAPDPAWDQQFGAPRDSGYHKGCDYMRPLGTAIGAMASGEVFGNSYGPSCGYEVSVDHGGGYITRYLHNNGPGPANGTHVSAGQLLTRVGSAPNAEYVCGEGAHLHFELTINGQYVDPHAWLLSHAGGSGVTTQGDPEEVWYSSVGNYGTATNGMTSPPIRAGYSYIQGANGVIRPVGQTEGNARIAGGQSTVLIQGYQLGPLAEKCGVMEVSWSGLECTPTGRILYGSQLTLSRPAW